MDSDFLNQLVRGALIGKKGGERRYGTPRPLNTR